MKYLFAFIVSIAWIVWPVSASGQILSFHNRAQTYTTTVDRDRFQDHRVSQVNTLRSKLSLSPYQVDHRLQQIAQNRSHRARTLGMISHRRPGSQSYYSYPEIIKWFTNQGVSFRGTGTLVVENIWYGYLKCRQLDCTDQLIQASQSTWNFFLKEQHKTYQPHYHSMIDNRYKFVGVGLSIDLDRNRYYLTAYYSQSLN
jgi:uncharacterized protein YkwD